MALYILNNQLILATVLTNNFNNSVFAVKLSNKTEFIERSTIKLLRESHFVTLSTNCVSLNDLSFIAYLFSKCFRYPFTSYWVVDSHI